MELIRALATLAEPPTDQTARLAALLGLDAPTPAAHTDLFVCQQSPYASVYVSADGLIGGEARDRVAGFWRALGLTPPPEPDHLATLLGFYAGLAEQAPERARHAFLWEHLLSWLPAYLQAVGRHAPAPFPGWATLLLDVLLDQARELGGAAVLPLHLRDVAALPDPREHGAAPFVDGLLAPAQSGMILTRDDLARAARALDIGVRAGERRLVLKHLLGADAPATLGWLASEARSWQVRHERLEPDTEELSRFWARRARATADLMDDLNHGPADVGHDVGDAIT